jgi:carbamoyltransferase
MALVVGVAGVERNASVAIADGGTVVAVCEQERVTRTRRAGMASREVPREALDAALLAAGRSATEISRFAASEDAIASGGSTTIERVDHHAAHAATAFYTSPFDDAIVLVCDRRGSPQLSAWRADSRGLTKLDYVWQGPAFADIYSIAAGAFGFGIDGGEYRLEALAHAAEAPDIAPVPIEFEADHLKVAPSFMASLTQQVAAKREAATATRAAPLAAALQTRLGDLLLNVVSELAKRFGGQHLCLGGGFFYTSYFTTRVAESGLYKRVFVPVNPGNAGTAIGAALLVGARHDVAPRRGVVSPFLGPGYATDVIKGTLDNCKLSYDYLGESGTIARAVADLARGKLVGWFQGRMEWGARALGNRSIVASPVAPFVLENLNGFLKHREPHRSYSVAVPAERVAEFFDGPARSDFMEFEYEVRNRELLGGLLPPGATRLRVQTVPSSSTMFHTLLTAFGAASGVPILVNTSFNGFNEPIVCTPRDAVRVFYGTGLDTAMIGNFMLYK